MIFQDLTFCYAVQSHLVLTLGKADLALGTGNSRRQPDHICGQFVAQGFLFGGFAYFNKLVG